MTFSINIGGDSDKITRLNINKVISYSGDKNGKWSREETQVDQSALAMHLTQVCFTLRTELASKQGFPAQTIPISNSEDLPNHLQGMIISFQRSPAVSEKDCFQQIKLDPELWSKAVEVADKIPFNEWVRYAAQLTPKDFIFWSNVLRHTRSQNKPEKPDA